MVGIGIHARLKIECRKACRFESDLGYEQLSHLLGDRLDPSYRTATAVKVTRVRVRRGKRATVGSQPQREQMPVRGRGAIIRLELVRTSLAKPYRDADDKSSGGPMSREDFLSIGGHHPCWSAGVGEPVLAVNQAPLGLGGSNPLTSTLCTPVRLQ